MITNTGKNIIAKYLVGQAPAYASYLAVGCGGTPLDINDDLTPYKAEFTQKTTLDFEMFRVPIISRGYVTDNGVNKIVLTAELPTEERYEITEVGIYSAGSNPAVGAYDSKMVFSFNQTENWEYHTTSLSQGISSIYIPLDNSDDVIVGEYKINPVTLEYDGGDGGVLTVLPVFQTNADNRIFNSARRLPKYERCRMLNNIIMMSGETGKLDSDLVPQSGASHIHLTSASLDFTKNAPTDLLKLAFSLVHKDGYSQTTADKIRILVEFSSTDKYDEGQWARFELTVNDGEDGNDFANNRYFIKSKQLQELVKSDGFSWKSVNTVKIYSSVLVQSGQTYVESNEYYVALDGLRLDNLSTANPLYGLTGYTILKNHNAETIVKIPNTTNFLEFRFGMDIV